MQIPGLGIIKGLFLIIVTVSLAAGCSDDDTSTAPSPTWGWTPLGSGMNDDVAVLGIHDDRLAAGVWFTTAGGVRAAKIAAWDGHSWTAMGGGVDGIVVAAFAADNDGLVVGGNFSAAGDVAAGCVALWTPE